MCLTGAASGDEAGMPAVAVQGSRPFNDKMAGPTTTLRLRTPCHALSDMGTGAPRRAVCCGQSPQSPSSTISWSPRNFLV
jgi:hypothetical protein